MSTQTSGLLQKECLLFISTEATTYTGSTITLPDRTSFQLQNIFFQSYRHQLSIFTKMTNKRLNAMPTKIGTKRGNRHFSTQRMSFFLQTNSLTYICFACPFISDTILQDCHSAAISNKVQKVVDQWVQLLLTYHKINITFRVTLTCFCVYNIYNKHLFLF